MRQKVEYKFVIIGDNDGGFWVCKLHHLECGLTIKDVPVYTALRYYHDLEVALLDKDIQI